jgi:hypothetical protein
MEQIQQPELMIGNPFAGQNGNRSQYYIQDNSSSKKNQIYPGVFIAFPGKCEERIIPFYQPEENHTAQQNGHPLPGGNILPKLHECFHGR